MTHLSGNPGWLNYPTPTTPITATALENLEAGLDGSNPLMQAGLRAGKLRMVKNESVTVVAGGEQTMLNVTGPGMVQSIWMAVSSGNAVLDGRLRVFYDGSATPAIDIDMGTLLATHFGGGAADIANHTTVHTHVQINPSDGSATGFLLTFPMPFGTSIKVTFFNSATNSTLIYSMVTYRLTGVDYAAGLRLRAQGARYVGQAITRTAGTVVTLANITTGPGWIVYHTQVGGVGAVNLSWMERNFSIAVDGEATPQIVATGTEDWFDSAFYFEGKKDFSSGPHSYVGTDQPSGTPFAVGMATDLMSKWGGVPFTTGAVMTADTEPGCTTGDTFSYCVLYYSP